MRKIIKLSFVALVTILSSCSELPEYELPYELSPTSGVSLETNVTAANAVCPAPVATFTVDSESTVYYVIQPQGDDALTSDDVFDDGDDVSFAVAGSEEVDLTGFDLGESYTIYAVTVNIDGTRSEEVTSTTFTMPSFSEVVDPILGTEYIGTAYWSGSPVTQFDVTLTENGEFSFDANALWGDFVAWAYDEPDYAGMFQYPGVVTLNEDFSVEITSEEFYAMGGDGTFDPCTGVFELTVVTNLFDDPDTEEVEPLSVAVELVPAE